MKSNKIPVTILTGFLGAGKTTILNTILSSSRNEKIAVVENEFGSVGIDSLLVGRVITQSVFELSNGCICCSLSGPLQDTMRSILRSDEKFDRIIIETTGIADPSGVIKPFLNDPTIYKGFEIDTVICIADSQIVPNLLSENKEALVQVCFADIVVINKTDTVSKEIMPTIEDAIRMVNPFAEIAHAANGICDQKLINRHLYSERQTGAFVLNYTEIEEDKHLYTSYCLELNGFFDPMQFKSWLMTYTFFNQKQVFRIKGYVWYRGNTQVNFVQVVRDSVDIYKATEENSIPAGECRLVFIGTKINAEDIEESLKSLILTIE